MNLNLKIFNKLINNIYFKMGYMANVIKLFKHNGFIALADKKIHNFQFQYVSNTKNTYNSFLTNCMNLSVDQQSGFSQN